MSVASGQRVCNARVSTTFLRGQVIPWGVFSEDRCDCDFPLSLIACLFASFVVVAVQSLSCVRLFETQWAAAHQASLSFTTSWSLFKLTSVESVRPSNHLIPCRPFWGLTMGSYWVVQLLRWKIFPFYIHSSVCSKTCWLSAYGETSIDQLKKLACSSSMLQGHADRGGAFPAPQVGKIVISGSNDKYRENRSLCDKLITER